MLTEEDTMEKQPGPRILVHQGYPGPVIYPRLR
jgi:hypothetical protein